ncbi:hypothetical protein PFICI_07910 [Pestalotiopsis fici W106-1]|uniref:Uncharacterized protein n=1 Tax=Pestalotiopsis fici (strain W106-1 / CGMCC3.15140) TaxID=1229662 RepID=W3X5B7_PESFW|nr:uncharacterized protein PFICI_07910 [Pestalotiopsis fici W106-1]ETS80381.1 hypothetical protein PFICI_07910 [Pestalotiopsis fici W106-1]
MFVARDQENLVARHQTGAALKQQQNNQVGARYPKTPIKIPLNDENGGHLKGAKSILGNRTKGNENAASSKGLKGLDKSNFVTPMQPRNRAVLGDKTTNAKSRGPQTVNAKSAIKDIGGTKNQAPTTIKPKQKQPQAETQKLQVHAEEDSPWWEGLEPEYCPPPAVPLSDDDDLLSEILSSKPLSQQSEGAWGFSDDYSLRPYEALEMPGKRLDAQLEELDRGHQELSDSLLFPAIQHELENATSKKPKATSAAPLKAKSTQIKPAPRKPMSTVTSKNAAKALSMDDTTKSMQRRMVKPAAVPSARKKRPSFAIPRFAAPRPAVPQPPATRRTPMANVEANSRTTLGYNKGRAAASALAPATAKPAVKRAQGLSQPKTAGLRRPAATVSNDPDRTITPARFASKQTSTADEDQLWKERVPFLSIFHPEDESDCDLAGSPPPELDDDEFEMGFPE